MELKKRFNLIRAVLGCLFLAPLLVASNYAQKQSTLYTYQNSIELQEEFVSGSTSSGQMGILGWGLTGGTITVVNSEANRIGIATRATGAGAVVTSFRPASSGNTALIDPSLPIIMRSAVRMNNNDTDTNFRWGLTDTTTTLPGNGIYLEKLSADANYFCVTRSGGVQTRVDSTVAVPTGAFQTFSVTRNSSGVQFNISGVNVCSLMTTNIPTTFIVPNFQLGTDVAASKSFDVDYWQLQIFGVAR